MILQIEFPLNRMEEVEVVMVHITAGLMGILIGAKEEQVMEQIHSWTLAIIAI